MAAGAGVARGYKPIIMMHGVGSDANEMATIKRLAEARGDTVATSLSLFDDYPAARG